MVTLLLEPEVLRSVWSAAGLGIGLPAASLGLLDFARSWRWYRSHGRFPERHRWSPADRRVALAGAMQLAFLAAFGIGFLSIDDATCRSVYKWGVFAFLGLPFLPLALAAPAWRERSQARAHADGIFGARPVDRHARGSEGARAPGTLSGPSASSRCAAGASGLAPSARRTTSS